jgi:hypothetical protein
MREVFAVLLLLVFSAGASETASAQETTSSVTLSEQQLGQKAIHYVATRFAIDSTSLVPQTHQPLTTAGKWSIAKDTPAICGNLKLPCVLLSYKQPGTDVLCQWTVLLKAGKDEEFLLDLNEDAARYFSSKSDGTNPPGRKFDEITGGKLISSTQPIYPELAKRNHLQGSIKLLARIDETGHVSDLMAISGPLFLRGPSIDAIKQWVYDPLRINSVPISVRTLILVNYAFR